MLHCKMDHYFDIATKKCLRVDFMTNPSSPNLIYAYPLEQYD